MAYRGGLRSSGDRVKAFKRFVLSAFLVASPFLAYVASYMIVLRKRPVWFLTITVKAGQPPPAIPRGLLLTPYYRFGGRLAEVIYWPLATIDRQLFPQRWVVTLEELERIGRTQTNHYGNL